MSGLLGSLAGGGLLTLLIVAGFGFGFALVAGQNRKRAAITGAACAVAVGVALSASPEFRGNMAGSLTAIFFLGLFAIPIGFYAFILRKIRQRNAPEPEITPAGLRLIEQDDALFAETMDAVQAENAQQPAYSRDTFSIAWRDDTGEVLASVRCEILMGLARIHALYVRLDARGTGLGRQVLAGALQQAQDRGAARAELQIFDWQQPEFYRHLGWTQTAETPYPAGPTRLNFEKSL